MPSQVQPLQAESRADTAEKRLELIRRHSGRQERDYAIHGLLAGIRREASRGRKAAGGIVDAWEAVVPSQFASGTRIKGIAGGVVRVGVKSTALSFELDRALRSGLLEKLRASYGGVLRRVRLEQDPSLLS